MKKIAVVGSRGWQDREAFDATLRRIVGPEDEIVSGGARGPDTFAAEYAREHNLKLTVFRPDWSLGRHAGMLRNTKIVDFADQVIAFWDGVSRGTADTIRKAKARGKHVEVVVIAK